MIGEQVVQIQHGKYDILAEVGFTMEDGTAECFWVREILRVLYEREGGNKVLLEGLRDGLEDFIGKVCLLSQGDAVLEQIESQSDWRE